MIDYTHVSFQTFKNPFIKMMNPFSSNNKIHYFQNFFRKSSLEIYKILQPMDIILDANIIIELPESLQCSNLSKKMKLPLNSIDVIISGNQTKTLQPEGCGKKGYKILTSISESKGIFFLI